MRRIALAFALLAAAGASCVSRLDPQPPSTGTGGGGPISPPAPIPVRDAAAAAIDASTIFFDGAAASVDACNVHPLCDDPLGCAPTYEQQLAAVVAACTCAASDASAAIDASGDAGLIFAQPLPLCAGQAGSCGGYHVVTTNGANDALTCVYSGVDQLVSATHCSEGALACGSSCEYCGHHPFELSQFCDASLIPGLCLGAPSPPPFGITP